MEIIIYKNKHDLILFVLFNRREIDTEVIIIDQIINVISFKCRYSVRNFRRYFVHE